MGPKLTKEQALKIHGYLILSHDQLARFREAGFTRMCPHCGYELVNGALAIKQERT